MSKKGKPFSVDTRPTKEAVVDSLTRDISVDACLFDLIDNSVDAARDSIFARGKKHPIDGLPNSYAGYKISLSFAGSGFSIRDNCGGITVERLKELVLRFGKRSSHHMGIGIFGLGLNRALFKLGRVSHLKTDTASQRAELVLNTEEYLKSDDWSLPAEEFQSSGQAGTSIEIRQLYEDIARDFSDKDWIEKYRLNVGRRYGRFIQKGLRIEINDAPVEDGEVRIREESPFPGDYKDYKTDGVTVHLRFGQHSEHRFTAEPDYEKARNAPLTELFGWTVLCNDRAIVISDKTWKTGWEAKFHSEFYGFVGVVSFDADDPAKLPWDTTKFDVDMNNRAYQTALSDMRKFAEKWRSYANQAKGAQRKGEKLLPLPVDAKKPSDPPLGEPNSTGTSPVTKGARKSATTPTIKKQPTRKKDHSQFWTVLPDDVDELHCFDKHLALVHEAKGIDLHTLTYSGMALIRFLFEATVVTYFDRHGKLAELKQFALDRRREAGIKIVNEKQFAPAMEEMIGFMENNPEVWGAEIKQNHLRHSLRKMAAHKKLLNGVVHNPYQPINKAEAFTIRDEVLPILRHLIEN